LKTIDLLFVEPARQTEVPFVIFFVGRIVDCSIMLLPAAPAPPWQLYINSSIIQDWPWLICEHIDITLALSLVWVLMMIRVAFYPAPLGISKPFNAEQFLSWRAILG
jgi:hypothetical protein